jgi:hypothetical protein
MLRLNGYQVIASRSPRMSEQVETDAEPAEQPKPSPRTHTSVTSVEIESAARRGLRGAVERIGRDQLLPEL